MFHTLQGLVILSYCMKGIILVHLVVRECSSLIKSDMKSHQQPHDARQHCIPNKCGYFKMLPFYFQCYLSVYVASV